MVERQPSWSLSPPQPAPWHGQAPLQRLLEKVFPESGIGEVMVVMGKTINTIMIKRNDETIKTSTAVVEPRTQRQQLCKPVVVQHYSGATHM